MSLTKQEKSFDFVPLFVTSINFPINWNGRDIRAPSDLYLSPQPYNKSYMYGR